MSLPSSSCPEHTPGQGRSTLELHPITGKLHCHEFDYRPEALHKLLKAGCSPCAGGSFACSHSWRAPALQPWYPVPAIRGSLAIESCGGSCEQQLTVVLFAGESSLSCWRSLAPRATRAQRGARRSCTVAVSSSAGN